MGGVNVDVATSPTSGGRAMLLELLGMKSNTAIALDIMIIEARVERCTHMYGFTLTGVNIGSVEMRDAPISTVYFVLGKNDSFLSAFLAKSLAKNTYFYRKYFEPYPSNRISTVTAVLAIASCKAEKT
jgi:hypothetical protein